MKETTFYIILNTKTAGGVERIGKFYVGNDSRTADKIFKALKGTEINDKAVLSLELMETVNGLPVNMKMLGCTLEELAGNCRIITKEVFKLLNMNETL